MECSSAFAGVWFLWTRYARRSGRVRFRRLDTQQQSVLEVSRNDSLDPDLVVFLRYCAPHVLSANVSLLIHSVDWGPGKSKRNFARARIRVCVARLGPLTQQSE
jgi:hypothetical protein